MNFKFGKANISELFGMAHQAHISYFGFQENPFQAVPGPDFLWAGERAKKALEQLRHEIMDGERTVVITGDAGTGKTTFAKVLMNQLSQEAMVAKVSCLPDAFHFDLFSLISARFKITGSSSSEGDHSVGGFSSFIRDCFLSGKKVVLILDEAQRLAQSHLEQLLPLADPGENGGVGLKLVLVGQNELMDRLAEESLRVWIRQIPLHYHLKPLDWEETRDYVLFCLKSARGSPAVGQPVSPHQRKGSGGGEIFTPAALKQVFFFSSGVPRLINTICDSVLLSTYLEGKERVLPRAVKKCGHRLYLPLQHLEGNQSGSDLSRGLEGGAGRSTREEISHELPLQTGGGPGKKRGWSSFYYPVSILILIFGILIITGLGSHNRNSIPTGIRESNPNMGTIQEEIPPAPSPTQKTEVSQKPAKAPDSNVLDKKSLLSKKDQGAGIQMSADIKKAEEERPPFKGQELVSRQEADVFQQGRKSVHTKPGSMQTGAAFSENKAKKTQTRLEPQVHPAASQKSENESEEMDPGQAIEWLLQRKSTR